MPLNSRPTPEQLLRQVEAEENSARSGRLKIFLGYASGVGKSFRMLDEGRRRRERGQDVVVGALQPQTSPQLQELVQQLEVVPPLKVAGDTLVMDVAAIMQRRPDVCLVDGLAYDNPSGSRHAHRWQDVEELLAAGISVITTINLQYVSELSEEVERIRGKRVSVTVPEAFLRKADEIALVDAPAEYCLDHGTGAEIDAGPDDRSRKLSQLREIALLLAADVVDDQLESYLEMRGSAQSWGTKERILVCITPKTNAERMIQRARLIRDRFHGELFVVYVGQSDLSGDDQIALERNLAVARTVAADINLLDGQDPVETIVSFAREHGITQIFIGHSLTNSWRARFSSTIVDRLIRAAEGMDVKLFPH
jgi:two-component system, OmpR family, sensor histidine kinase KdpD